MVMVMKIILVIMNPQILHLHFQSLQTVSRAGGLDRVRMKAIVHAIDNDHPHELSSMPCRQHWRIRCQ